MIPSLAPMLIRAGEVIDKAGDGAVGGSVEVQKVKLISVTLVENTHS